MKEWSLDELKEKLKVFLSEDEINKTIEEALKKANLPQKLSYSKEEMHKLLDVLIEQGGFVEFVARNFKVKILLEKD